MDQLFTPRALSLSQKFQAFASEQVAPRAAEHSRQNQFDRESYTQLLGIEFFQLIIPRAFGGLGENWWEFSAALEGMARGLREGGFLLTLISQSGFIRALTVFGTEKQKSEYFQRFLAGEVAGTAIAEPHTGTDLRGLKTIATSSENGYLLNGEKRNIAHAASKGFSLVFGRIPAEAKGELTLFLVDHSSEGYEAGEVWEKMGNRTIPNANMRFRNLPLSLDNILGKPGEGLAPLQAAMTIDRIYYGWMGSQLLFPFLEEARAFCTSRFSGGKTLSRHQHIQRKISDALIGMEQARALGMQTLHQFLSGHSHAPKNSSITKLSGAKALETGTRDLLSVFGSEGYQAGALSRLMADALGWISVGGTEEAHRMNIFNHWRRNV